MTPTAAEVIDHVHHFDDIITLDETARHRRRILLRSDGGLEFLLNLPSARLLRHGEGLVLSDGRVVKVQATPEDLYAVSGQNHRHLLALAWQIGNRHLAAQIEADRILIRQDPVIKTMLEGLNAEVVEVSAPFNPEGGAYDHNHSHEHEHE